MATNLINPTQNHNFQHKSFFEYRQTIEEYDEDDSQVENGGDGQFVNEHDETEQPGQHLEKLPNQYNPTTQLLHASWQNNFEQLQEVLRQQHELRDFDVNFQDPRSYSALHYSSSNGDSTITEALLERGSQANIQDRNGDTPLIHAAVQGNADVVVALVEHGADVNIQNASGESALHLASSNGHCEIVDFLLEHAAVINQCTLDGVTALHFAAASGDEEIVLNLLKHGAHCNAVDEEGDSPLHWAVREGRGHVLPSLVENGANVDLLNEDDESPLQLAAVLGEQPMVNYLATHSSVNNRAQAEDSLSSHFFTLQ